MTTPRTQPLPTGLLHAAFCLAACLAALGPQPSTAADLITEAEAQQQGLTREWFSQVRLDASRHTIESVALAGEQLVVLTTAGSVQAFDAETGLSLWATRVGNPNYPSVGPAVGGNYVAVVNGTTLFVLDRTDGRELRTFHIAGGAGGGPAVLDGYVYVPLFSGRLQAFSLAEDRLTPWYYSSSGRLFQTPVTASESVVWTNDAGRLYGGNAAAKGVRYWFEGGGSFVAAPTALGERVYAATVKGDVYALDEQRGRQVWRYTAADAILHSPVAIGDRLFVATDEPALHALDRLTGKAAWVTGGVARFVAASERRVYGLDRLGSLLVMDRETGAPVSRVASRGENTPVLNQQTDRLYVYSRRGLLQCFHEIGADEPYRHRPLDKPTMDEEPADKPAETPAEAPAGEPAEDTAPNPFGDDDPFGGDGGDPFGGGDAGDNDAGGNDDPFGGDDDPFGF